MTAVYTLWLRQLKRYARARVRVLGNLGQPLLFFTGVFSGIELLWDRQFGFLKETLVAPVPRLHIVAGRSLGGATIALVQGLVVLGVCLAAGFRVESLARLPAALAFMALIALAFTALGTMFGAGLEDMQAFPVIMNFLIVPIFFLSGALFPLAGLPRAMRLGMELNPLTYGVDGLRAALAHGGAFGMGVDFAVLGAATAGLLALGSWLFSRTGVSTSLKSEAISRRESLQNSVSQLA